jgi:hypothetical protein
MKQNGRAFGRLRISKGGVEWMQKSDSRKAFAIRCLEEPASAQVLEETGHKFGHNPE